MARAFRQTPLPWVDSPALQLLTSYSQAPRD
ncbi:hypothetical protein BFJ68_g14847 [Fusarium oxysporum]|uniref:Uncharacterized protein n=1 Tax=Fusarium oxysporum TaxID=5507 RepID=A0A420PRV5_FUSOX|nr:hypothetical protein BFJ68_g14847 [Fusarium oxysporum]